MSKKVVSIYTDGACSYNPGPGGWAAILIYGDIKKEISGGEVETTNNRMELMAAIEGMKSLREPCIVELYTDSAYLYNTFNSGWIWSWQKTNWIKSDKKPVVNVDLWQELLQLNATHEIHWHKVKGHSDNELNNRCDELARGAIDELCSEIPCEEEYKLYMNTVFANRCGSVCTYVIDRNSCEKYIDSSTSITRLRLELEAVIEALSIIETSSIVGIYATDTMLYGLLTGAGNSEGVLHSEKGTQQLSDIAILSDLVLAHDIRLHIVEDKERDDTMIKCQEESRCEMTRAISNKARAEERELVKLYITGTANANMGAWCVLDVRSDGTVQEYTGAEFNSTQNSMRLQGLTECLEKIDKDCIVEINTDSMYLYETATSWIDRWKHNDWKKSNNKRVTHAELWQKVCDLSETHEVYWRRHEKNTENKLLIRCRNTSDCLLGK